MTSLVSLAGLECPAELLLHHKHNYNDDGNDDLQQTGKQHFFTLVMDGLALHELSDVMRLAAGASLPAQRGTCAGGGLAGLYMQAI